MRVNIDVISVNLIRITLPLVTKMNKITMMLIKKRKRKKITVYLQTARALIFDHLSERNYVVKVLRDPGYQQTYIS